MKAIVGTWGLGAVACVSVALSLGACGSSDDDKGSPGMQNTGGSSGSGATTGGTSGSAGTGTGAGAGGSSAGSSALPVAGAPDETGAGKGGGGGSGGQTSEPTGTVSNLPGVDFQVTLTLPGSNLVLVSSNLTLDTSTNYVEWFAEVRNLGTIPACFVQAEVDFADHTGAIVESLMSFSDGDAYEIGSDPSLSSPCIAPGKSSVIWA
ncbi:MAG TPA: hypothetical protein VHV51_20905, partial [Polyangiaceae bacterium]|nr:hypothetical protein [Polyangiaceae bacterium]